MLEQEFGRNGFEAWWSIPTVPHAELDDEKPGGEFYESVNLLTRF